MKVKNYLLGIMTVFFLVGCAPKISNKIIEHAYYNLTFSPEKVTKTGPGKVEITVMPIDAASINRETFEAASRDGNYEKELAIEIEKRKNELDKLSKAEKAYVNGKINGINAVSKLENEKLIPANTAYQLKMRIWYGKEYGRDGTEVASLSDIENYPDNFNPYKINQKYLSVFKVTFENKGDEIEKVSLKDFQIVSGEELLFPLGEEYFKGNLGQEAEKINNVYRMNMPLELSLAPSQRISKFIAIPAIDTRNENLQIQIIKGKDIVNFDFIVKEQFLNKQYKAESYNIYVSGVEDFANHYFYYALSYENGVSFAANSATIFTSEEKKTLNASIYAVAVHKINSKAKTARKVFKFVDQKDNKIVIPFKINPK
jgi:hypothetical protein